MKTADINARPLFRWQGGKIKQCHKFINLLPPSFGSYFEPFIGCSSLYFELWNRGFRNAVFLGDLNENIVEAHLTVKSRPLTFFNEYSDLVQNDSKEYFKRMRDADVSGWPTVRKAARTIYLAKAAYCGLLKTKSDGTYTASYGDGLKCNVASFCCGKPYFTSALHPTPT